MQFYTVEKLGPKRSLTPEGFLLCEDVPIARTGVQVYGPGETQVTPGGDGLVYISREESEVFRPETIASFNGKPVLNDHPDGNAPVNPETWSTMAVGVVLNPRRGKGTEDNYLYADLLIQQADAIADVMAGKREVSCGYGADWVETSIGHGEQRNIVGNHVALVERARCGGHCSIGDAGAGEIVMFKELKKKLQDAFNKKDQKAFDEALEEAGTAGVTIQLVKDGKVVKDDDEGMEHHVHVHTNPEGPRSKFTDEALEQKFAAYDKRHAGHDSAIEELNKRTGGPTSAADANEEKAIEGELKEEAPPGTGDKAAIAKDSAYLETSFQETMATAEILVPGVQLITFDKAREPKGQFKDMCNFRRRVLILAGKDQKTAQLMQSVRRGRSIEDATIQSMPCGVVRDFFYSVGELKKQSNNTASHGSVGDRATAAAAAAAKKTGIKTIAELNAANRKKFGGN